MRGNLNLSKSFHRNNNFAIRKLVSTLLISSLFLNIGHAKCKLPKVATDWNAKRESLQEREQELEKMKNEIDEGPYSASQLYKKVVPLLEKNSKEANTYFTSWYEKQNDFQKKSLALTLDKQQYVMEKTHADMERFLDKIPEKLAKKYRKKYKSIYEDTYQVWEKNKNVVATKEQRFRTYNFDRYLNRLRNLTDVMKTEEGMNKFYNPKDSVSGPAFSTTSKLSALPGLLSSVSKVYGQHIFGSKPKRGETPITKHANKLFRRLGKHFKYDVKVEGRENIPKEVAMPKPKSKDIYFFFPPHKNGVVDAMVLGSLEIPNYIVFANASTFVSKKIAAVLQSSPEFIAVGPFRGKERKLPADKFFESLKTGVSNNAVNFPSGFVSNIGEILPIRTELSDRLIGQAIEKGYNPIIVPLAFEVGSAFLTKSGKVEDKDTAVKILPPLPSNFIKFAKKFEDDLGKNGLPKNVINTIVTSLWVENIKKHKELKLDEIEERLHNGINLLYPKSEKTTGFISAGPHCIRAASAEK